VALNGRANAVLGFCEKSRVLRIVGLSVPSRPLVVLTRQKIQTHLLRRRIVDHKEYPFRNAIVKQSIRREATATVPVWRCRLVIVRVMCP